MSASGANASSSDPDVAKMIDACSSGNVDEVRRILNEDDGRNGGGGRFAASTQDDETGMSPLMAAARQGHLDVCRILVDAGAPWNAVDRTGRCAGNYATECERWDVVNFLVDAGVKAELILGASMRLMGTSPKGSDGAAIGDPEKQDGEGAATDDANEGDAVNGVAKEKGGMDDEGERKMGSGESDDQRTSTPHRPVEYEPCTKPDYLSRPVRYNSSNTALLDDENDAVMMEWERPLMNAHASILTGGSPGKRVLNVGFGMGIIDRALQTFDPKLHIICEAHPDIYKKMCKDGWDKKDNVRICFGKWQDELPKLIEEGVVVDGVFFDTYGEHFSDMEDFHATMVHLLAKPGGIYSFFNGLAPDNIFFHGVACQCVKLQLAKLGLETEFAQCEIQVKEKEWEGIRRKYWHGRDTYYLPIVTWNKTHVTGKVDGSSAGNTKSSTACRTVSTGKEATVLTII